MCGVMCDEWYADARCVVLTGVLVSLVRCPSKLAAPRGAFGGEESIPGV